ncbi:Uncharacterized protein TCM_017950 [Theobroma cacao]|uniref:Uncharacterized protein n=1 Tax=Theobroma cacao TaxID=3641 RepID=A0A061ELS7_THECC|nr:Uncharacterized protein TCM_017950 [Theobroma cacao]
MQAQNTVATTNQAAVVTLPPVEGGEINGSKDDKVVQNKDPNNTPRADENAQQGLLEIVFDCVAINVACPRDRTEGYDDNPPNLESASGKGMYNKELNDIPSISSNNHAELEVHPRERHRRHLDNAVPFWKTFSSATKDVIVMSGNEGDSDEDSISISFVARNHQ